MVYNDGSVAQALKPKLLQKATADKMDVDKGFLNILNRFRDGEFGDFCRTNKTIKLVGYRHFNLRRHEGGKQDAMKEKVSKLTYPTLQHCLRMLHIMHTTIIKWYWSIS